MRLSLQLSQNDSYVYREACKAQSDTVAATATLLLLLSYLALDYKFFQGFKQGDLNDLYLPLPTHCFRFLVIAKP